MDDLKTAFHRKKPKFYPSRQRFTLPQKAGEKKATALAPGKRLTDYGLEDGSIVIFKDLGPQVLLTLELQACCKGHCPRMAPDGKVGCGADRLHYGLFLGVLWAPGRLRAVLPLPARLLPHILVRMHPSMPSQTAPSTPTDLHAPALLALFMAMSSLLCGARAARW